jgi:hypothetical protein
MWGGGELTQNLEISISYNAHLLNTFYSALFGHKTGKFLEKGSRQGGSEVDID